MLGDARLSALGVGLRRLELADADALYRFRNDDHVRAAVTGTSHEYSTDDLREWVRSAANRLDRLIWAITATADNVCIGHVGLYDIDLAHGKAEFGIIVGDSAWRGRGIGQAVTRFVVDYGFQNLRLHKVYLTVLSNNSRAKRLYQDLGMHHDGTARADIFRAGRYLDVEEYSLLEAEWTSLTGDAHPQDPGGGV